MPGACATASDVLTSVPICKASVKLDAPTGKIMNSCIARALPAWLPPLMMLNDGTGSTCIAQAVKQGRPLPVVSIALSNFDPHEDCTSGAARRHGNLERCRARAYQLGVAGKICDVLVQRHVLLCSASLDSRAARHSEHRCSMPHRRQCQGVRGSPLRLRGRLPIWR